MTKMKTWLSALLVIQLALAIGFYWNSQHKLQENLPKPLVDINWEKLDQLVVGDDAHRVTLSKVEGQWFLSDAGMLPTEDGLAEQMLDKLKALQTSWPVASTESSHERFEVTEETLSRYVSFYQGDKLLGKLIVGSSPGLKKRHVRMADEDNVYAVSLELVDMITNGQAWLDHSLLTLDKVTAIQGMDYKLQKQGDDWQLQTVSQPAKTLEADTGKVGDMIYALKDLQVHEVVTGRPDLSQSGYGQITVKAEGEEDPLVYQFYMTSEKCYVARNDYDVLFVMNWGDYEKIAGMDLEKLSAEAAEDQAVEGDSDQTDTP
jgi:hypothetical protein